MCRISMSPRPRVKQLRQTEEESCVVLNNKQSKLHCFKYSRQKPTETLKKKKKKKKKKKEIEMKEHAVLCCIVTLQNKATWCEIYL